MISATPVSGASFSVDACAFFDSDAEVFPREPFAELAFSGRRGFVFRLFGREIVFFGRVPLRFGTTVAFDRFFILLRFADFFAIGIRSLGH